MLHHKSPDTFLIKLFDVFMSIVTLALQGKKQGLAGVHQMTAVDEQVADVVVCRCSDKLSIDDFRNLLQGIILMLHGFLFKFPAKILLFRKNITFAQ